MSQVTLISGVERRRVWTDDEKRALVAAACEPAAVAPGAAVVLEIGGAALRIAGDAPPALVSAVVRSLRR